MKIFLSGLLCLSGVLSASESLTMTNLSPATVLTSSQTFSWTESYDVLTSWELSFTLSYSISGEGTLFRCNSMSGEYPDSINLVLNDDGSVSLVSHKWLKGDTVLFSSNENWVKPSDEITSPVNITLTYVSILDEENTIVDGEFSASIGSNSFKIDLPEANLKYAYLHKAGDTKPLVDCTFGYSATNFSLVKLDDRLPIPEPATATLGILALSVLTLRRRR